MSCVGVGVPVRKGALWKALETLGFSWVESPKEKRGSLICGASVFYLEE